MGAVVIILLVACVAAGAAIGHRKGRTVAGIVLGLFGLIGLLILAFIPKTREAQIREAQQRHQVEMAAWTRQQNIEQAAEALRQQP